MALTNREAIKVRREMHDYHNKQYGLRWSDFPSYIEEYCLGRNLTKAELKRFVESNTRTIDRQKRNR